MTEKELMLFAYQQSTTPVIKNPILQKAMDQGPRIKVAERDNMNTPDLEQSPDSFLKPGETLEDFDVEFRRPNAEGGMQQLVQPNTDGSRPGYSGNKGYVKPLSPELEKLFNKTNPGEEWGKGKFSDERARGNWKNDAPRKQKILNTTSNLITQEELAKILTEELGEEISGLKIMGKYGVGQRTKFSEIIEDRLFKGTYGSIKGGKNVGGSLRYFKKPSKNDIKKILKSGTLGDVRINSLNTNTVKNIKYLNKKYGDIYKAGNVPDIKLVMKGTNMTEQSAGTATARLAQIYNGHKFNNENLKGIRVNKNTASKMFEIMDKSPFGNPYRNSLYKASLTTIDEKLGNETGTFESLKKKATKILKENKIPVYDFKKGKKAFGFNINEIAGVTGSAKSKAAEFSQFIDVMEGNLNQKTLANFQGQLSIARQNIEGDKSLLSSESKRINKLARNLEGQYDIELPRLRDPDATKFFSPTRLKELNAQGLDIVKAAERAGYTIEMPKGSTTINEFVNDSKKQIKVLKKMGFRCNKAGGGVEDVACYLEDVKKTKADARSSDVLKRAKALTKERKALSVAKTLPKVGNIIRKGVQVGAGAVSSALSAVGFGPVGVAIEAAIEGGFYDNARRNGYTHEQAYAETFLPKLITDAAGTTNTNTKLFEGADAMIEKEKLGKEDSLASKFNNAQNIYFKEATKLDNMVNSYLAMKGTGVSKKNLDAFLEKIDQQEAKVRNLTKAIKPGTPEYEAYKIAEENQAGRIENRKNDYLSMNRIPYVDENFEIQEKTFPLSPEQIKLQEKKLQSKIRSGDKRRNKEMQEYKTDLEGNILPPTSSYDFSKFKSYDDKLIKFEKLREIGGLDLTDKIGLAGGVANMAQGGIMSLKKKWRIQHL